MPSLTLGNQTFATQNDAADPIITSNVQFPAGTVIGNASLSYEELGSDAPSSSNTFTLAHMDTKSHTANCSVTFDNDQWSFDQAGDYILSVSLVFYRSNGSRIAIFKNVGGSVSLAYMGQYCIFDTGEVGAGTLHINGYRFTVANNQITGAGGVVKYGVYRWSTNGAGTYSPTSFPDPNVAPKHSQVTLFRVAQ